MNAGQVPVQADRLVARLQAGIGEMSVRISLLELALEDAQARERALAAELERLRPPPEAEAAKQPLSAAKPAKDRQPAARQPL